MIHIYVDYQGKSDETYSFTNTGPNFRAKLDELEAYYGKIDEIQVYTRNNAASSTRGKYPSRLLVKTTNVGIAVRKARRISYPPA